MIRTQETLRPDPSSRRTSSRRELAAFGSPRQPEESLSTIRIARQRRFKRRKRPRLVSAENLFHSRVGVENGAVGFRDDLRYVVGVHGRLQEIARHHTCAEPQVAGSNREEHKGPEHRQQRNNGQKQGLAGSAREQPEQHCAARSRDNDHGEETAEPFR